MRARTNPDSCTRTHRRLGAALAADALLLTATRGRAVLRLVSVPKFIPTLPDDVPHVYVAGALAHGKAEAPYADECIAISQYPLSGAAALGRLCNGYENLLGIL